MAKKKVAEKKSVRKTVDHGPRKMTEKEREILIGRITRISTEASAGLIIVYEAKEIDKGNGQFTLEAAGTAFAHGMKRPSVVNILSNTLKGMQIHPVELALEDMMNPDNKKK